jgi:hypothetical protein
MKREICDWQRLPGTYPLMKLAPVRGRICWHILAPFDKNTTPQIGDIPISFACRRNVALGSRNGFPPSEKNPAAW